MDVSILQAAAARIQHDHERAGSCRSRFAEIATRVLQELPELPAFSLASLPSFLAETKVAQPVTAVFSDLPIVVHDAADWRLEVLIWTHATPVIHDHQFCGAFRVLHGSSLHTPYELRPATQHGPLLALGEARPGQQELLVPGDVRTIGGGSHEEPGGAGSAHALFHLAHPSVTLVARTSRDEDLPPQRSVFLPDVLLAGPAVEEDDKVQAFLRALEVDVFLRDPALMEAWMLGVAALDAARVFGVGILAAPVLHARKLLEPFSAHVRASLGDDLAGTLEVAMRARRDEQEVIGLRAVTREEDARLLLALLLTCRSREALLRSLETLKPGLDPLTWLKGALQEVCGPEALLATLEARIAGQEDDRQLEPLYLRLVEAATTAQPAHLDAVLWTVVAGGNERALREKLRDASEDSLGNALEALRLFRDEPSLAGLWS